MAKLLKILEKKYREIFPKRIPNYKLYQSQVNGKNGLEIGGPSFAFSSKGFLPLYEKIGQLDGCNFSDDTVWEGKLTEGKTYKFGNKKGHQFIADAADLSALPENRYDFVLSCHSLEHLANPLNAVEGWLKLLVKDGLLILIVPHKDNTFDYKRPLTTLSHLKEDKANATAENDRTHFSEVLSLHGIERDAGVNTKEELKERTESNIDNRCVHHHVFNTPLIAQIANYFNLEILDLQTFSPFHIIAMLRKTDKKIENNSFLNPANPIYHKEKFPSDKIWN